MKFHKKRFRIRWHTVVPVMLMVGGIGVYVQSALQFVREHSSRPLPSSSLTISPLSSQSLKSTSTKVLPAADKIFSEQEIQKAIAGEPKLGYLPYPEGNPNIMIGIASYSKQEDQDFERLAPDAGLALMKLIEAARKDGVWIIPISGFRSSADQEKLFNAQIQRSGSPEAAAKQIAPPGYSELQTGYAVNLGDGRSPKQDLTVEFAKTDAFRWLTLHAQEYGFELSFPENNPQGVSYQPWHWRFVASPEAQTIFSRSKSGQ
jgi:D-alanyl-D-alanine carboxypeptidase